MHPLDEATVASLLELGNSLFAELVIAYIDDSTRLLAALDSGVSASDTVAIARAAHDLKSTSAALGAREAAELAGKLEHDARGSNLTNAAALTRSLATAVAEAQRALRERAAAA